MAMIMKESGGFCEDCQWEFNPEFVLGYGTLVRHLREEDRPGSNIGRERFAKCSLAGRWFRIPVLVEVMGLSPIGHPEKPAAASGLGGEALASLSTGVLKFSVPRGGSYCIGVDSSKGEDETAAVVIRVGDHGEPDECVATLHIDKASGEWVQDFGLIDGVHDDREQASALDGEAAAKLKASQEATWMPMVGRAPVQGGEAYRGACPRCSRPMIEHGPHQMCPSPEDGISFTHRVVPVWPKTAEAEKSEALFRSFPDPGKNSSSAPPVADAVPTHTRTVNSVLVADTAAMVRQALMGYTLTPAVADKLILALAGEIHRVTLGDWSAESKLHVTAKIPNSPAPKEFRREITFTILDGNPARVLGSGITPTYDEADAILGELLHTAHGWIPKVTVKFQPEVGNQPKTLTDEQLFGDPVQPTQRPIDIGMDGVPHVSEPLAAASVSAVDRIQDVTDQVMARYPAASGGVSKPIEFEKGEPDDFPF